MLDQQLALPPKLRTKSTVILDIVGFFYSTTQSFLKRIPLFDQLTTDVHQELIQFNSEITGTLNSIFIVRETKALESPAYDVGCSNLYGQETHAVFRKTILQLEQNGTLFKLILLILAFSSGCSLTLSDLSKDLKTISNTNSSFHIQNMLVIMVWKYLIYQYGLQGAVSYFDSYIRFILKLIKWVKEKPNEKQTDMVDTVIENTTKSLIIED